MFELVGDVELVEVPCGWTDRQAPDGTIVLTAPTGHQYVTQPHGGALFAALRRPTGELDLPPPPAHAPDTDRTAMMPRRRQTREQDRRDRITQQRRERSELNAAKCRASRKSRIANHEPPPF